MGHMQIEKFDILMLTRTTDLCVFPQRLVLFYDYLTCLHCVCGWSIFSNIINEEATSNLIFNLKMMSLTNKLADWPSNYHKTAKTFPQIF